MDIHENLVRAAEQIEMADAVLITAGAGVGVDSGLPDFRGKSGFWDAYPPVAKLGISFSEMANPIWFYQKPALAWAFYGHRLNLYRQTNPHYGFQILLELASNKTGGYFVFTSNVDGQFQKAGFEPDYIEECHGSIHHMQCCDPCSQSIWSADNTQLEVDETIFEAKEPLPVCPHCGGLARPNILMFGDWNWIENRSREQHFRLNQWISQRELAGQRLAIIELGAGTAVATVRYTSEELAHRYTATLIRINPRDYQVPYGHFGLPFGAKEGMERLQEILGN
jgi:NAD-dependent SIR2 family protein deacetylase